MECPIHVVFSQIRIINEHGCHLPRTRSFERCTIALACLIACPVPPVPHSLLLSGVVIAEAGAVLFSENLRISSICERKREKLLQACAFSQGLQCFRYDTHSFFRSAWSRVGIEC